ncbi:MAG: SMC family ATPase, partial [Saccharolobus sp.]
MKIKKIELSDFISHQQSSIEFKGEVNVIIGPNGAGKSSIVDGISFSLFRDSSRGSQEELIRIGSNRAKVKLTLSNEKDTIYIERNISKGSSTIEDKIILNGKPLAFGARNVSNEIEKILGIDKNVALSTIIVRQGELDLILDNFHDIISNILKLDSIRKLVDSRGPLLNYKKEFESKLKQLELINQYRIEREKDLKVKEDRISQLQEIIEKLLKEIEKLREEYNRCEDQFEEYDKIRLQFTQISSELKEKKSRYNKLQEEIEKLDKE